MCTNVLGATVGVSKVIESAITTSNGTQYTSGDNIGSISTLGEAIREAGRTAIIQSISIWDKDNQKSKLRIDFWYISPSGTFTNNSPQVISADFDNWIGSTIIDSTDYDTTGTCAQATKAYIGLICQADVSEVDIYMTVKVLGTPTFTSTSGLIIKTGFLQD